MSDAQEYSYLETYNPEGIEKYRFIHHFVPHEYHRTRARLLSHNAFFLYCILTLLLFGLFNLTHLVFPGVLGYASEINVADLLKSTNNVRVEHGLSELTLNPKLSSAAELKASDMFEHDYWAHVSPTGVEPWSFILNTGYDYSYAGENLAKNFNNSKDVVEAWFQSPSHRDNLLSTNYDEIGFAVKNGVLQGYETTLVVQFFGRPRNTGYVASVDDGAAQEEIANAPVNVAVDAPLPNIIESPESVNNHSGILSPSPTRSPEVKALVDVSIASKTVGIVFGGFLVALLVVDIWYSKKKGILKLTGHTLAHITFLIAVMITIVFVIKPGSLI